MIHVFMIVIGLSSLTHTIKSHDHGTEKTLAAIYLEKIGQSDFVHKLEERYSANDAAKYPLAKPEYQKIAKEMQVKAEIPDSRQVHILEGPDYSTEQSKSLAFQRDNNIYIVEKNFSNPSLVGSQRFTLAHETIHLKYHDSTMIWITGEALWTITYSIASSMVVGHCINKARNNDDISVNDVKKLVGMWAFGIIGSLASRWGGEIAYSRFCEHRADIEACNLVRCYKCIQEKATMREFASGGYASREELSAIAEQFKQQELVCSHHQAETATIKDCRSAA